MLTDTYTVFDLMSLSTHYLLNNSHSVKRSMLSAHFFVILNCGDMINMLL